MGVQRGIGLDRNVYSAREGGYIWDKNQDFFSVFRFCI